MKIRPNIAINGLMGKRYSIIPYKGPKKYNCSAEQETDAFHKNKNIPPKIVEIRFETETTSIILKGFVFLKYLFLRTRLHRI